MFGWGSTSRLGLCTKLAFDCFTIRAIKSNLNLKVAKDAYFAIWGLFWGSCLFREFSVCTALRNMCGLGYRTPCRPHFIDEEILTAPAIFNTEYQRNMHQAKGLLEPQCPVHFGQRERELPMLTWRGLMPKQLLLVEEASMPIVSHWIYLLWLGVSENHVWN